jgi:hypothetical protein
VSTSFDKVGHVQSIKIGAMVEGMQPEVDFQYCKNGQLKSVLRGAMEQPQIVTGNYAYDALGRLTSLNYEKLYWTTSAIPVANYV